MYGLRKSPRSPLELLSNPFERDSAFDKAESAWRRSKRRRSQFRRLETAIKGGWTHSFDDPLVRVSQLDDQRVQQLHRLRRVNESTRSDLLDPPSPIESSVSEQPHEEREPSIRLSIRSEEDRAEDLEEVVDEDDWNLLPDDLGDRLEDVLPLGEDELGDGVDERRAEEVLLGFVDEGDKVGKHRGSRDEGFDEADGDAFEEGVEELVGRLSVVVREGDDLERKKARPISTRRTKETTTKIERLTVQ